MKVIRVFLSIILLVGLFSIRNFVPAPALASNNSLASAIEPIDAENVDFVGQTGEAMDAMAVQGNYAYVGESSRLAIIDISNPDDPQFVAKTDLLPGIVANVTVAGNYAYLGLNDIFGIIDISDPADPKEIGFYPWEARAMAIVGDYAYVITQVKLQVINISDPTNLIEVGSQELPMGSPSVAVSGNYLYVGLADYDWYSAGWLVIFDISTPASPVWVTEYGTDPVEDVSVDSNYAYLCVWWGLEVIDVSDPGNPYKISQLILSSGTDQIFAEENTVYLLGYLTLYILDVTDQYNPVQISSYNTWSNIIDCALMGDYLYLSFIDGFWVINISNPHTLHRVGAYYIQFPISARNVFVSDGYAYAANNLDEDHAFQVVDVSDPAHMNTVGSLNIQEFINDIAIAGNYAFLAVMQKDLSYFNGLRVIDISDPANPIEVSFLSIANYVAKLAITGNYVYIAAEELGLVVVDISDPSAPRQVALFDTPGMAFEIAISGAYAYVADRDGGLLVIDVSDPTQPFEVCSFPMITSAWGVAVAGNYAYIPDNGLRIFDISDPSHPHEIGSFTIPDGSPVISVSGNLVFQADVFGKVWVIDISNPAYPTQAGYFTLPDSSIANIITKGSFAIVANYDGGVIILKYTGVKDDIKSIFVNDLPDPSIVSRPFMVRVKPNPEFGLPSGDIVVTVEGESVTCIATLVRGTGECFFTFNETGIYKLFATYNGDQYFNSASTIALHTLVLAKFHYLPVIRGRFISP